jgi:hypothetical protein
MRFRLSCFMVVVIGAAGVKPQTTERVPSGVILVKGAWSSASDSATPVPEGGSVTGGVLSNKYFGITFSLPAGWTQKYMGPPPSESGRYVLAQIGPSNNSRGESQGNILVTAQDMFFAPLPAANSLELARYEKDHLPSDYEMERQPSEINIAGSAFSFFSYWSPAADLHWYVLATKIRCHVVEFVLTSRDTKLLESLVQEMNRMELPAETSSAGGKGGGAFPVCIRDYAKGENLLTRVNPVLTTHRFNEVPVRIVIDKSGEVKHIHFLSAFPDQARAITDALRQWKFKPYLKNGQAVSVETGIIFGRTVPPA